MSATHAEPLETASRVTFWRTRLGSLLAVFPLGLWTIMHLWDNLSAYGGAQAWQSAVTQHPHSAAKIVTSVVVLLPLLFHTVWGLGRMRQTRMNIGSYRTFANLKFLLQRLSALGLLAFLGAHIWLAMLSPRIERGRAETFAELAMEMRHHTPTLVVYLLGTLGVAYHLANGLHTFAMSWGVVSSRKALNKLEGVAYLAFICLLAMAWGAIYALWKAGSQ